MKPRRGRHEARGGWPLPACGEPMRIKPHQTGSLHQTASNRLLKPRAACVGSRFSGVYNTYTPPPLATAQPLYTPTEHHRQPRAQSPDVECIVTSVRPTNDTVRFPTTPGSTAARVQIREAPHAPIQLTGPESTALACALQIRQHSPRPIRATLVYQVRKRGWHIHMAAPCATPVELRPRRRHRAHYS